MEILQEEIDPKEDICVLDFPQTRQATDHNCGEDSIANVCAYYGIDIRQDDIDKEVQDIGEGIPVLLMIEYLRKLGLKLESRNNMTISDLVNYINNGIPVIIALQAWSENENIDYSTDWNDGHYSVVIGYSKDKIIFSEPSLYTHGFMTNETLLKRWHDTDDKEKNIRFGIAVSGKKPVFDSKHIEEIG